MIGGQGGRRQHSLIDHFVKQNAGLEGLIQQGSFAVLRTSSHTFACHEQTEVALRHLITIHAANVVGEVT